MFTLSSAGGEVLPRSSEPVAVAVFSTEPLATSPPVMGRGAAAVHTTVLCGARPGGAGVGQVTGPSDGSFTDTLARVTVPVFVTKKR